MQAKLSRKLHFGSVMLAVAKTFIGMLFLLLFIQGPAYADAGDGSGGGGGAAVPLYIQASYPANGARNVSVAPGDLWVQYSHNVADPMVSSANLGLLSLQRSDGVRVAANIWCYDAQLYFDQRQHFYITPLVTLEPSTQYSIVAVPGVAARNGIHVTSSTEVISFTTEAGVQEKPIDQNTGDPKSEKTGASSSVYSSSPDSNTLNSDDGQSDNTAIAETDNDEEANETDKENSEQRHEQGDSEAVNDTKSNRGSQDNAIGTGWNIVLVIGAVVLFAGAGVLIYLTRKQWAQNKVADSEKVSNEELHEEEEEVP